MQAQQLAAVGAVELRLTTQILRHFDDADEFRRPVTERRVELQPVALGPQARMAQKVLGVDIRKQVFAGGDGPRKGPANFRIGGEIQGIDRLLEPG